MKLALRRFGQQQSGHQEWEATTPKHNIWNNAKDTKAKDTLLSWLERAAQTLMQRLAVDAEPRVWYTCDAEGRLWWHATEPITGRSLYNASEAEMRVWLEQRHYPSLVG